MDGAARGANRGLESDWKGGGVLGGVLLKFSTQLEWSFGFGLLHVGK